LLKDLASPLLALLESAKANIFSLAFRPLAVAIRRQTHPLRRIQAVRSLQVTFGSLFPRLVHILKSAKTPPEVPQIWESQWNHTPKKTM